MESIVGWDVSVLKAGSIIEPGFYHPQQITIGTQIIKTRIRLTSFHNISITSRDGGECFFPITLWLMAGSVKQDCIVSLIKTSNNCFSCCCMNLAHQPHPFSAAYFTLWAACTYHLYCVVAFFFWEAGMIQSNYDIKGLTLLHLVLVFCSLFCSSFIKLHFTHWILLSLAKVTR